MKLAIISTEKMPVPAIRGGAIQMMIEGICPFLEDWYELTIFSAEDPELPHEEIHRNIRHVRLPNDGYSLHVANELKKGDFDLIHICNRPKDIPLYKKTAPNSKFVISLHNDMFSQRKIMAKEGLQAVQEAALITAVSSYIKQATIARFPEAAHKVRVLYSGVNLDEYPPVWTLEGRNIRNEYREKYHLQDQKVILFAGRLSKVKGPHVLIEAMEDVLQLHPDAVLVIAGGKWFSDNSVNQYVRQLYTMARRYGNRIIFTQFIPAKEIPRLFLMADVFVCSSQWEEPLARVHYEAMAAGVPLITSNRGGNPEVVLDEYSGLIVQEYDDPKAYARAIHRILSEPEATERMVQNGRRFVEANFTFEHVAKRLHFLYTQALLHHRAPAVEETTVTDARSRKRTRGQTDWAPPISPVQDSAKDKLDYYAEYLQRMKRRMR